jgi:hypothetical protein
MRRCRQNRLIHPIIGHNNCSRSDVGGDAIGDSPEDSVPFLASIVGPAATVAEIPGIIPELISKLAGGHSGDEPGNGGWPPGG